MRVVLYSPEDADLIKAVHGFLSHLKGCPDCTLLATLGGREYVEAIFDKLNSITIDYIALFDYDAAIEFCNWWLSRHTIFEHMVALEAPVGGA